ncbi:MAG: DUF3798 domain-containing protein [Deltaproteobacteria bacterium]|jgi:hypothetical protein|nr:DUF3798 domain-containing protein [Deltaproteobacteria bacterium]
MVVRNVLARLALALCLTISCASLAQAAPAKYHIGVVTGTVSQAEDELRGAELMIKAYGDVKDGGMIQHLTYPNNFGAEQETTISQIVSLATDPLMKAIVMNQSVPGATEGFRRVREMRPDILLLAGVPHEDPLVIGKVAHLAMRNDFISAGYRVIWAARQLGAKTFVHISFPRHMSIETLTRRRMVFEQACNDLGVKFVFETAPDPLSDVGVVGAQQFMLENVPKWVQKYGKDASFYATNDAHTEPLIRQVVEFGGSFVEASLPSPLLGYPGALGIDLKAEKGDFPAIVKKVESVVVAKGAAGRLGTWSYSFPFSTTTGLVQHAMNVIEGKSKMTNMQDILKAFGQYTPGSKWAGSYYVDGSTGVKLNNYILLLQDTYIFGKGYIHSADLDVPDKYLKISSGLKKKL